MTKVTFEEAQALDCLGWVFDAAVGEGPMPFLDALSDAYVGERIYAVARPPRPNHNDMARALASCILDSLTFEDIDSPENPLAILAWPGGFCLETFIEGEERKAIEHRLDGLAEYLIETYTGDPRAAYWETGHYFDATDETITRAQEMLDTQGESN